MYSSLPWLYVWTVSPSCNYLGFTHSKVRDARISAVDFNFISLYTTAPAVAAFAKVNLINTVSNAKYAET